MNLEINTDWAQLRLEQVNLFSRLANQAKGNSSGYSILQNISFEVFAGDRLIITGRSGAGKSSLLRLLNRLCEPSSGKIYLENQEYRQIPVLQLRQQITLVPQDSKLLGMTVRDTLAYPLLLRNLPKPAIEQRLSYWQEKLHIPDDWLGRTEVQLSVGQRQLVTVARGLVIQPKILLLDEPTSALDANLAENLIAVLNQLTQAHQTTVLMVNHQLDLAESFCTRVLHLEQGNLLSNQLANDVNWTNLRETLKSVQVEDFGF